MSYQIKILTGILTIALLTGCSLTNSAGDQTGEGAVSGSAVSGSAVDPAKRKVKDQAEKNETPVQEVENCLANDDNQYWVSDQDCLGQARLDGSHEKEIEIENLCDLCWVNNEWVYYISETDTKTVLSRIPIRKTEHGDALLPGEKEVIVSARDIDDEVYVTDTYIIFIIIADSTSGCGLYKLDLVTQEKRKLLSYHPKAYSLFFKEFINEDSEECVKYPVMKSGKLFVYNQEKIWLLDPDAAEIKLLVEAVDYLDMEVLQDKIYVEGRHNIYLYDERKEEAVCVLSRQKMVDVLVQEGFLENESDESKRWSIMNVYDDRGRLYLHIYEEDIQQDLYRDTVYSISLQSPEDFRYEKEVSDFLQKYNGMSADADCIIEDVKDGKMLLVGNEEADKDTYAIYDLDTKEIREISEREAEELFP